SVYNLSGLLVLQSDMTGEMHKIEISQLPAGIYLLKLEMKGYQPYVGRFIKK
nr:T9SS type A sorting domain-containing protein [Breznakibacter sp.]